MGNGINSSVQNYGTFNEDLMFYSERPWLMTGDKWGSSTPGTGTSLTFSFYTSSSTYKNPYGEEQDDGGFALEALQESAIDAALDFYSAVIDVTFTQVVDSATLAGDIRFANSNAASVETAEAYYPSSAAEGGDIWFGTNETYTDPTEGNYAYYTILHELGHALGLQHPHEDFTTPSFRDAMKYTVMSYRSYVGGPLSLSNDFFATTLMVDDIAALQAIYGANTSANAGTTVYTWSNNEEIFETIWDGSGNDTLDFSNQSQGVVIRLTAGSFSSAGAEFWNGEANVRDCLAIAYDCRIENAIGTSVVDTLIGSTYANGLTGGGGADVLVGGGGNDKLTGGSGADKFRFATALNASNNVDTINDFSLSGDLIQLDNAVFKKLVSTGTLSSANFRSNTTGNAVDSNDYILYERDTGNLFYDSNGNASGGKIQFAVIGVGTHAALTAADFSVI